MPAGSVLARLSVTFRVQDDYVYEGMRMSLTPVSPDRCGHVAPMVIDRVDGGYAARCLRCGTTGPVKGTSTEACLALLALGRRTRSQQPGVS